MFDFYVANPSDEKYFGVVDGVGMDVKFDSSGLVETISGSQKLAQSLQKMLSTNFSTEVNKEVGYGTYLPSMLGEKMDPLFTKGFIISTIEDAIANYISMQQAKLSTIEIPDTELCRGIVDIQVQELQNSNTQYAIVVKVSTWKKLDDVSYEEISVGLSLSRVA